MQWSDFLLPNDPYKDSTSTQEIQSFQYAGALRIPPPLFQPRSRKEVGASDTINSRFMESTASSLKYKQSDFYRPEADPKVKSPDTIARLLATTNPIEQEAGQKAYNETYTAFINKNKSNNPTTIAFVRDEAKAAAVLAQANAIDDSRQTPSASSGVPDTAKGVFFDMAPLSSRTDTRDFRQSKPYDTSGPSLAMNPFFDRYDPTRDPRNMIREVRSVVYELKEADRGIQESERIRERTFTNRNTPEGSTRIGLTEWQDLLRPKIDNIEVVYRQQGGLWSLGSKNEP